MYKKMRNIWTVIFIWCIAVTGLWLVAGSVVGCLNLLYEDWATEYLSIPVVMVWQEGIESASQEHMQVILESDPWVVGINSIGAQEIAKEMAEDNSGETESIITQILPSIWQVMVKFPVKEVLEVPTSIPYSKMAIKVGEWENMSGIEEVRWDPKTVRNLLFTFKKWSESSDNLLQIGKLGWVLVLLGVTLLWLVWPVKKESFGILKVLSTFIISSLLVSGLVTLGTILLMEFLATSEVEPFLAYSITSIVIYMVVVWSIKIWIIKKHS